MCSNLYPIQEHTTFQKGTYFSPPLRGGYVENLIILRFAHPLRNLDRSIGPELSIDQSAQKINTVWQHMCVEYVGKLLILSKQITLSISLVHFHPLIFIHLFSLICFHPPVFTQKVGDKGNIFTMRWVRMPSSATFEKSG